MGTFVIKVNDTGTSFFGANLNKDSLAVVPSAKMLNTSHDFSLEADKTKKVGIITIDVAPKVADDTILQVNQLEGYFSSNVGKHYLKLREVADFDISAYSDGTYVLAVELIYNLPPEGTLIPELMDLNFHLDLATDPLVGVKLADLTITEGSITVDSMEAVKSIADLINDVTKDNVATLTNKFMDDPSNFIHADAIHYYVKTTEAITTGDTLMSTGYNAGANAFEVAKYDGSKPAIGICHYPNLAQNAFTTILSMGRLEGNDGNAGDLDTSSFAENTIVYPDSATGGWTDVKPSGLVQEAGFVFRSHATNGVLLVSFQAPIPHVFTKTQTENTFSKPSSGALFTKISPTSFTIPIGFKVRVGNEITVVTEIYTLDLNTDLDTGVKTAGTDYYVYAKDDGTFYISADKTITTDRLIGGFHYGLVPEDELPTGNKTELVMVMQRGIWGISFWDLKFRATASNDGMVFFGKVWYDLYLLNSEHITNGTSKAGATIAGGVADTTNYRAIPKIPLAYGGDGTTTYGKFTWFQASEIAKSHGKRLITYEEFITIAYGVSEEKSSQTNAYETIVGKVEHYPHLTSNVLEQATGTQWLWGADVNADSEAGSYQAVTDGRGSIYANANELNAVILGGTRDHGVDAGSRASRWSYYVWLSYWHVGSRFASAHLELV